jgi:hypothetical protein
MNQGFFLLYFLVWGSSVVASLFAGRNALPGSDVAAEVTLFMSLIVCWRRHFNS